MNFDCLQDFRNVHRGRPIFVAGAGPSLRFVNSSLAEKHIVIAVNASILKFIQAEYFFTCDETAPKTNIWLSLENLNCKIIKANNTIFGVDQFLKGRAFHFQKEKGFKMNMNAEKLIFGTSSIHPAVHFAQILGGNPIVLLGCDCTFSEGKKHFTDYEDQPDYYALEEYRDCLKLPLMEMFDAILSTWRKLKKANPNVNIINTSGGRLEAFPRENLDALLRRFSK